VGRAPLRVSTLGVAHARRTASSDSSLLATGPFTYASQVLENLMFFGRLHGLRKREASERGLALLTEVGVADAARRPMSTYSHGMQKRVSVARALLTDPPVLLVDEATHDLDPEGAVRRLSPALWRSISTTRRPSGTACRSRRAPEIRSASRTLRPFDRDTVTIHVRVACDQATRSRRATGRRT